MKRNEVKHNRKLFVLTVLILWGLIFQSACSIDSPYIEKIREQMLIDLDQSPEYKVIYDGNGFDGGEAPTDGNSYKEGSNITVLGAGTMTLSDNYFISWNTAANGLGITHLVNDSLSMPAHNLTLYAQWTTTPTYSVTYNGNGSDGGTVPSDINYYEEGVWVPVNPLIITKTGNSSTGYWNTEDDGSGASYTGGNSFMMGNNNVVLYAQWTINQYNISYYGNGSTEGSVPTEGDYYFDTIVSIANPGTMDWIYGTFDGWKTHSDGSGIDYTAGSSINMPANNLTLNAQWKEYAVGDSYGGGGIIFYDDEADGLDNIPGKRFLLAAPSLTEYYPGFGYFLEWGADGTNISGAWGTAIGTGEQNTIDAALWLNANGETGRAAQVCSNLIYGGIHWFLPSKDELNLMFLNLHQHGLGDFQAGFYWSSSEDDADHAWAQYFYDEGQLQLDNKNYTSYIRAIRAF